jgi:hypothetical protein
MNNRYIAGLDHIDQSDPRYEPQFISDLRKKPNNQAQDLISGDNFEYQTELDSHTDIQERKPSSKNTIIKNLAKIAAIGVTITGGTQIAKEIKSYQSREQINNLTVSPVNEVLEGTSKKDLDQTHIDFDDPTIEKVSSNGGVLKVEEGSAIRTTNKSHAGDTVKELGKNLHSSVGTHKIDVEYNLSGDVYYDRDDKMFITRVENVRNTAKGIESFTNQKIDEDGWVAVEASPHDFTPNDKK